jgi:lysophospholipase L1-like esterase
MATSLIALLNAFQIWFVTWFLTNYCMRAVHSFVRGCPGHKLSCNDYGCPQNAWISKGCDPAAVAMKKYDGNVLYLDRRGFDAWMRACLVWLFITLTVMILMELEVIPVFPDASSLLQAIGRYTWRSGCWGLIVASIFTALHYFGHGQCLNFRTWHCLCTFCNTLAWYGVWWVAPVLVVMVMLQFHRYALPAAVLLIAFVYSILHRVSTPPPNNALAWKRYYDSVLVQERLLRGKGLSGKDKMTLAHVDSTARRKDPVVLTCFGDGLLHGTVSAPITTILSDKLQAALSSQQPVGERFSTTKWWLPGSVMSPQGLPSLAVVNCAQNGITSDAFRCEKQRLRQGMAFDGSEAEYILLWIGTNDVRAVHKPASEPRSAAGEYYMAMHPTWLEQVIWLNSLQWNPPFSLSSSYSGGDGYIETKLKGILHDIGGISCDADGTSILDKSRLKRHVAVLTLPPMGEDDLNSPANRLIDEANAVIARVIHEIQSDVDRNSKFASLSVVPVHERLVSYLQQTKKPRSHPRGILPKVPVDWFLPVNCFQSALYHSFPGMFTWKSLSAPIFGHAIMSDGLHLHETGSDIVADAIVEWLLDHGITDRL